MRTIDSYKSNLLIRTKQFGSEIIKFSLDLPRNPAGFTISDQLLRAATSIGANLIEAQEAVSNKDFLYKISFALKEAKETKYWLELVELSLLPGNGKLALLLRECEEIVKILVATLKKLKQKEFSKLVV